jgi:hypothetical protein
VTENLKIAKWRVAVDIVAQASSLASSGSVSLPGATPGGTLGEPAEGTSALQTCLSAIERVPSEGRGKAAQFIPTLANEGKIWREFLGILETVEKPVLIHYGSYEITFLKEMKERHGGAQDGSVAAKAIDSAINLISVMFAKIYFPTFSNGLKEIARNLGLPADAVPDIGKRSRTLVLSKGLA